MVSWLKLVPRKSYNTFTWVVLIVFVLINVVIIGFTSGFESEATLQCNPDKTIAAANDLSSRKYITVKCFQKYQDEFHHFLPLNAMVALNFGLVLVLSIIYAYSVKHRVEIFAEPPRETANGGEGESQPFRSGNMLLSPAAADPKQHRKQSRKYVVFTVYVLHLIICRILPLALFGGLLINSMKFPTQFDCPWPIKSMSTSNVNATQPQGRTVDCTYPIGSKNETMSNVVKIMNLAFGTAAFIELVYLLWSLFHDHSLFSDFEFCCVYLLRKRKSMRKIMKQIRDEVQNKEFYLHDNFGQQASSLGQLDINVIIQEGREITNRSGSYTTHLKRPANAVPLGQTSDLFKPIRDISKHSLNLKPRDTSEHPPKTTLVVAMGRPGIGKTLLTKKILHEWQGQVSEFWHDKIVILVQFRSFNQGTTSLRKMLEDAPGLNMSSSNFRFTYEIICLNPSNVVFIFDGLDELKYDENSLNNKKALNNPDEEAGILQIFMKIANGKLLPGATVLITSRATAENIYQRFQLPIDREIEIFGFNYKNKIKSYIGRLYRHDIVQSLWQSIKKSPQLLSLSYIPLNCFIICLILKETISDELQHVKGSQDNVPPSMTELYKRASEKYKDKPLLCGKDQSEYFRDHITSQEFNEAQHVVDDMEQVESFLIEHIDNPEWHLVIQFVAGLIGDKIRKLERERNASQRSDTEIEDDERIIESICKRFQNWMSKVGKIDGREKGDNRKLLVIKCVHEMQVVGELMTKNGEFLMKSLSIAPVDFPALFNFFGRIRNLQILKIDDCAMENFAYRELANLLKNSNNEIKDLRIENCGIVDEDAKQVINELGNENCKVTSLVLAGNKLTAESAKYLRDILMSGNCKLTELNLDRNKTSDAGANNLREVVKGGKCQLSKLILTDIDNSMDKSVEYLSQALKSGCKLEALSICGNKLTNESAKYLNDALESDSCKLTELTISDNKLTDNWMESFSRALMSGKCQLVKCDIRDNEFTDKSAEHLSKAVKSDKCELEALDISSKKLSNTGTQFFCDALKSKKCKLTRLGISGNKLTDKSAEYLRDLMKSDNCNLTALSVRNCNLTDDSAECFSDALKSGKLRELDISGNELSDAGTKCFSQVLMNESCKLTKFHLTCNNNLTDESAKYLSDSLKSGNCNLTELSLSSCKLTSDSTIYFEDFNVSFTDLAVSQNEFGTVNLLSYSKVAVGQ